MKENEMLARAGIKPRTAANPARTALGNISNRATVASKQVLKDKEVGSNPFSKLDQRAFRVKFSFAYKL